MNKKQIILIIVVTIFVTWTVNLFVGNYLAARISTLPLARKFNLFNPQAPIVVNNREVVRVNNTNDVIEVTQNAQSKIAAIVYFDDNQMVRSGGAINWTSDGYFVSSVEAFSVQGRTYAVVTGSGEVLPVEGVYPDTASNLALVKTTTKDLPVLDLAEEKDVRPGQQIVLLLNSLAKDRVEFNTGYVSRIPIDESGLVYESDEISGMFNVQVDGQDLTAQPALTLTGRLLGLYDSGVVIPATEIQMFVNNFFEDNQSVARPAYGFTYKKLVDLEAKALQTEPGVVIESVVAGRIASRAGLRVNDRIVKFGDTEVKLDTDFDMLLRKVKPGTLVRVTVDRAGQEQVLTLTPASL